MPEAQSGGQALTLADGSMVVYGASRCSLVGDDYTCVNVRPVRFVP
jgi:hypothetical protein